MTGDHRATWPLIGRDRVLNRFDDEVARHRGVIHLLHGPAGVGKSALARALSQRLSDASPILVQGLAEQSSVPLGAFAAMVDELAPPTREHALTDLVQSLGSRQTPPLMVVDDAPRLDELSAEAVARLITGFGATVIATARAQEELPARLGGLDASGLLRRHELGGLEIDEIADLLQRRFRLPAADDDIRRLAWETGGNALHLRMLVESAIDAGQVVHRGTHVEIRAGESPTRLAALVESRVAELEPDARHVLCLVAICQPVAPGEIIETFAARRHIAELVRRGLLMESAGRVSIAHPLIAETIESGPEVSAILSEALRLLRRDAAPARRFRAAEWELRAGRPTDPTELTWAAGYATATGDARGAARLAAAAAQLPGRRAAAFAAQLTAATAASAVGELDVADARFDDAAALAQQPRETIALARHRGEHLAFRRGDPAAAIAHGEEALQQLDASDTAPLDADLWRWRTLAGGSSTAPVRSAIAATIAAAARGEFTAARTSAVALAVPRELLGDDAPSAAMALGIERFCALRAAGDGAAAASYLESLRAEAHEEVGLFTALLAWQRTHDGRFAEAEALADLALEQLGRWDGGELTPFARAVRATIAAQRHDTAAAARMLEELDADGPVSGAAQLARAECEAFLTAAAGEPARAAEVILRAVENAIDSSYDFIGALTLAHAVRFGDIVRAARVAETLCQNSIERIEPALAVLDAARALESGRVEKVISAATRLSKNALTASAVDVLAMAGRGDISDADHRRLAAAALALRGDIDAPLLHSADRPLLTPRELDVARAAARRLRSREIAEELGISVRTVDNQLQSAYRKLGVRSRDALRDVLAETGLLTAP